MTQPSEKQQVITRLGQLKAERATWWAHWQEISLYLLPRAGRYFAQDRNKGWKRHNNIYDNTGTRALRTLAAGLMGGLTSPARPWFRLSTSDPALAKHYPVKLWLAQSTRIMLDVFQRSNTYRALHGMYEELGAFGTAACVVAEDYNTIIHHYPLTAGEYCIATDWQGRVCTLYREFEKTVGELVKEFGIENVSGTVKSMYDSGSLDKWVTVVHAVEPRADREPGKRDARNMPWKSVYYELGGDPDKPLRVSGYKSFRVLAPRWAVSGGDVYGSSPGMEALGDIKQLQQEQLRKSQGIDYMSNPPLQVPSQLKNRDVDRLPGGITFYDPAGASPGIRSMFEVRLDLNHLLADIQDVRSRINSSFYADLFLMLANDVDTRKTATEVAQLQEEKMLMLGPVLERLHNELLMPLVDMAFDSLLEGQVLPPPPPELHGQDLNIELVSMLAQAQRAIATNGIDRFVGNLGQVARFKPDVLDKFNADEWVEAYSDMLGVEPELIVPDDKVAVVRQQRAQAQAQAQQGAMLNQQADTAAKLANAPTKGGGNALSDVMGMLSGGG
ncbi:MAG TPA: portal protein [Gallionellaceae bacterium]